MKGSAAEVAIVGGGIIGCALARELAGRGASVTVIERGRPGAEASGALESRDLLPFPCGDSTESTDGASRLERKRPARIYSADFPT